MRKDQTFSFYGLKRNQEVKIYFSPDNGGLPLCRYGKPAGHIAILPVLGLTLQYHLNTLKKQKP